MENRALYLNVSTTLEGVAQTIAGIRDREQILQLLLRVDELMEDYQFTVDLRNKLQRAIDIEDGFA